MTAPELEALVQWDGGLGRLSLHAPLFGREIRFVLFPADNAPARVTDRMAAIIDDVLGLPASDLSKVKDFLWEECLFSFQVTDYGVEVQAGESSVEACLREFRISGPDDAWAQAEVREIHVVDEFQGRFAEIKVETAGQTYISIVVRNGRIIDWDDDGAYLAPFDMDERHAHHQRAKVLSG